METRKYSQIDIRVPAHRNSLLEKTLALINEDVEIKTLWRINNINAIDRLGMPMASRKISCSTLTGIYFLNPTVMGKTS